MWIPKQIGYISKRLNEGHTVHRVTVRDLLGMFKAERRGLNKVNEIREALDSLGLETVPDFASAWIDAKLRILLKSAAAPTQSSDSEQEDAAAVEEMEGVEDSDPAISDILLPDEEPIAQVIDVPEAAVVTTHSDGATDPTYRIGNLPAANKSLVTIGQDDLVIKAVTSMLQNDFSQLPIMHGEREVKGVITWKSIATRMVMAVECPKVQDCREDAQVVDANITLFEAIPTIVKHGYVLVRDQQNRKITGIVTSSDLSLRFQQLTEPFLLLREIELHIREILNGKVSAADLVSIIQMTATAPPPKSISDLSFGGYIRLLQHPTVWKKLDLKVDQTLLTKQLESVREIRNDVMHFDPDPMTETQLEILKSATRFMQQLYELLP